MNEKNNLARSRFVWDKIMEFHLAAKLGTKDEEDVEASSESIQSMPSPWLRNKNMCGYLCVRQAPTVCIYVRSAGVGVSAGVSL